MKRLVGAVTAVGATFALGACAQILGYQDIPDATPDAGGVHGSDAHEAGKQDATVDARDATGGVDVLRGIDGGQDTGHEASAVCGTMNRAKCLANGLGIQMCGDDGGWSAPSPCPTGELCTGGACHCVPGATECSGQAFQRCVVPSADAGLLDARALQWSDATTCEAGQCSLSGCQPSPLSCVTTAEGIGQCPVDSGPGNSCCTSDEVPAGGTVSGFRLDRYEVTVARFREFVRTLSVDAGAWRPEPGSGKHAHLHGGRGLVDRGVDGGESYERGWDPAWNPELASLAANTGTGNRTLQCPSVYATWTATAEHPGMNDHEALPINCVTWVDAYAFCIWDGGFLPSEAEWSYAAAGGSDDNVYPWTDAGQPSCILANFTPSTPCDPDSGVTPVGSHPLGASRWSSADLAGNVDEWTLDVYAGGGFPATCSDCALLTAADAATIDGSPEIRVERGGSLISPVDGIKTGARGSDFATNRSFATGFRCARTP